MEPRTVCLRAVLAALVLLAWGGLAAVARAQAPGAGDSPPSIEIIRTGCSSCNSGLIGGLKSSGPLDYGCTTCGGGDCANCVPGRQPCDPHLAESTLGRFFGGLYNCLCCPDPCYEGKWSPLADSAFFTESARPVTQTRFRWASANNFILPDRNEFFWARADGNGKGPRPTAPFLGERRLRYNDLVMVAEGGTGLVTVIAETTYRNMQPELAPHASGFADLVVGPKTLIFDCELLQIATMFKTYIPSGNFGKGLGTGHVSLEPSLLVGLKLSPTTYLQAQLSQWIPLGGDPAYSGGVLHYHASVNQEICRILPDVVLIGTGEFNGWSFQDGLYTDPVLGAGQKSSGYTYASLGGGMRLLICDKVDLGFGALFSVSRQHFARELFHTEFRLRF